MENLLFRIKRKIKYNLPDSFFKSDFWRQRQIKEYMNAHAVVKLQIGSGRNMIPGWLNTDMSIDICKDGAMYLDAGETFPFPDHSIDYVYSEHLFEHLSHDQAVNMLKECHRVLKPSGVLRIATPDFHFLEDLYLHPEKPANKSYIEWSAKGGGYCSPIPETPLNVINKFHTEWGHKIIYDRQTLTGLLKDNGYKDIRFCGIGQSSYEELKNVEGHFKYMPYEHYQLETMILEATTA